MSKTTKTVIISLLSVVLLALSFGVGCALGAQTSPNPDLGLEIVEEAWNVIFDDYVNRDSLDASTLSQAAIEGMIEALDDPYTSYIDAETYELGLSNIEGKFDGIGAQVAVKDEQIIIIAPIADSPAAKAGIRAGDTILEVNGNPVSEMSLAEAVLNIRGERGTPVTLLILHEGDTDPVNIEIVRDEIELPSVKFDMKGDIAYINITYFSQRTSEELSLVLQDMTQEAPAGIILDLRSNPGGTLESVVDVASYFLNEGIVVSVVDSQGRHTVMMVEDKEMTTDLPLVVLVDSYSASGSEVLAGALQDHSRATIAGAKTFGKGSVNILRQLKDGSGIYITTARWLTPNGRLIEGEGLPPDHELGEDDDAIQWALDYLKTKL